MKNTILIFCFFSTCLVCAQSVSIVAKNLPEIKDQDTESPSIECVFSSRAVTENGYVELWAIDLLRYYSDNKSDNKSLVFTYNNELPVDTFIDRSHYFIEGKLATYKDYRDGKAQKWHPSIKSSTLLFSIFDDKPNTKDLYISVYDEMKNVTTCHLDLFITNDNNNVLDLSEKNINIYDRVPPIIKCMTNIKITVTGDAATIYPDMLLNYLSDNISTENDFVITFNNEYPVDSLLDRSHYFTNGRLSTFKEYRDSKAQKWHPKRRESSMLFKKPISDSEKYKTYITAYDAEKNYSSCRAKLLVVKGETLESQEKD